MILVIDIIGIIEKLIKSEIPEFAFTKDIDVTIPDSVKDKDILIGIDELDQGESTEYSFE